MKNLWFGLMSTVFVAGVALIGGIMSSFILSAWLLWEGLSTLRGHPVKEPLVLPRA